MLDLIPVSLCMHNEQQTLKRTADKSPVLTARKSSLSKHDPDIDCSSNIKKTAK